jgi:hypothetical protein
MTIKPMVPWLRGREQRELALTSLRNPKIRLNVEYNGNI